MIERTRARKSAGFMVIKLANASVFDIVKLNVDSTNDRLASERKRVVLARSLRSALECPAEWEE